MLEFTLHILFKIFCSRKGLASYVKKTVEAPVGSYTVP